MASEEETVAHAGVLPEPIRTIISGHMVCCSGGISPEAAAATAAAAAAAVASAFAGDPEDMFTTGVPDMFVVASVPPLAPAAPRSRPPSCIRADAEKHSCGSKLLLIAPVH